jgi:UDP-2,4-diacetamido-2,4,6-trideoxy-beta-L-altropyranose hydrolase
LEACRINVSGAEEKWRVRLKVVFRVDASLEMGIGHVMRCLTLAQVLKENGVIPKFICRKHEGNLIDKIHSSGFNVHELEVLEETKINNKLEHSHWLGATQKQDADDCVDILKVEKTDWLIVDHYALDEQWHKNLKPYYEKIMVIDDLADRKYYCDILLDQTFGRQQEEYSALIPEGCKLLLGSQYALLRPEFSKWRAYSLERRSKPKLKQLLINMGGVDVDNVTENVIDELKTCNLPNDINITVVMGGAAPHIEGVKHKAKALPYKVVVRVDVDNMAEIMANADIAIGAAGSTTWERCCLGLPTIQIVTADNQINIAKNLEAINSIQLIDSMLQLSKSIDNISHSISKMSLVSSSIVDSKGSTRVAKFITSKENHVDLFFMRPAKLEDADFVYSLQTKGVREYFVNSEIPSKDQHVNWFQNIINSLTSQLFILMLGTHQIGVLRVDNIKSSELEISIIISPSYSGKGLAKQALKGIESLTLVRTLKAIIHNDNIPSKGLFVRSGYIVSKQNGDFLEYVKNG